LVWLTEKGGKEGPLLGMNWLGEKISTRYEYPDRNFLKLKDLPVRLLKEKTAV